MESSAPPLTQTPTWDVGASVGNDGGGIVVGFGIKFRLTTIQTVRLN
jgi:hypothetical protein